MAVAGTVGRLDSAADVEEDDELTDSRCRRCGDIRKVTANASAGVPPAIGTTGDDDEDRTSSHFV
jgi:hypothetical protein